MVIIRFFFQPIRPIRDFQFDLYPAMHPGSLGTIITPASQILIPNSGFASGNGLEKLSRGKQGVFDRLGAEVHQRHAVAELVRAGHAVISVDITGPAPTGCRGLHADLTDAGQVYQALAGADAVVHMGAWANAGMVPDTRTYGDNVQATFNVFQAAADMDVRRIVSASSNQVYGFAGAPPLYAPVDEGHPLRPLNCYALSKMAGE